MKYTKKNAEKLLIEIDLIVEISNLLKVRKKENSRSITNETLNFIHDIQVDKRILKLKIQNFLLTKRENKLKKTK